MIRIKKAICHYCWIENHLHEKMMEEVKKVEPMWFIKGPASRREKVAMKKFMAAQKQKCISFGEIAVCYEHLQKITKRLFKVLNRKAISDV